MSDLICDIHAVQLMSPDTVMYSFRGCVLAVLCCSAAAAEPFGEAACCMLFRPSHTVSRSEPAVNTDTYIHMHRLHAGRYLFRLKRHMIVHSSAHTHTVRKGEKEQNVYEYI